jgi:hypothetical protein
MVFDTPDHLYRLLDSRAHAVVRDLLANHNGLFRFGDRDPTDRSNTFKVEYLPAGKQHRLTVERQQAPGATRGKRFQLAVEDLLLRRGAGAIERKLNDDDAAARCIARDLKADFDEIWTALWPPGPLEQAVAAHGLQVRADDVVAWLTDDLAGAPFSLRTMDVTETGMVGADTFALVCRHENARVEVRFKSDGSPGGARAVDRMHRLAKGIDDSAWKFGTYSNLRTLMAQFMRLSVEEEAPARLSERARSRVPRVVPERQALETRTRDYVGLPIPVEPAGVAAKADCAAVACAVRASLADYSVHARDIVNIMAIGPQADTGLSLHTLDSHTWAGLQAIQTTAAEKLARHPLPAFCRTLRQQMTVPVKTWGGLIVAAQRASRTANPQDSADRTLIPSIPAPPGTEVVRFQVRPPFWQALWGKLVTPWRGANADHPAWEQQLVPTGPKALRFPLGMDLPQIADAMGRLGAAQTCLGLPRLYEKLHGTLYDSAMHDDVLPAVRTAVANVIGAMRREMREAWAEGSEFRTFVGELAAHFDISYEKALSAVAAMRNGIIAERDLEAANRQRQEAERAVTAWKCIPSQGDTRLERGAAMATAADNAAVAAVEAARQAQRNAHKEMNSNPAGWQAAPGLKAFRQSVLAHEHRIDQHERLLRQRLAAVRVGEATLGEFDAWSRAETAYAQQPKPVEKSVGDQGHVAAVGSADAADRTPRRQGPQCRSEAIYWNLIERLSGIESPPAKLVGPEDAISAYLGDGDLWRLPPLAVIVRRGDKHAEIPTDKVPDMQPRVT